MRATPFSCLTDETAPGRSPTRLRLLGGRVGERAGAAIPTMTPVIRLGVRVQPPCLSSGFLPIARLPWVKGFPSPRLYLFQDDSRRGSGWSAASDRPNRQGRAHAALRARSEEHTSELRSLMSTS